jgi:drug/metabolite transporter (DMT)-like permease
MPCTDQLQGYHFTHGPRPGDDGGMNTLFPLLAVCIWTGNTLVTKFAATAIEPAAIAFYRWLLAGTILTPFVARAVWRKRAVVAQHWSRLALLGALGMALYQGLAYQAARTTTAVNMGVIVATMPLMSALLAVAAGVDRLTRAKVGGALLSLAGVAILAAHGAPGRLLHGGLHPGDALMLVAVASNAVYGILLKRWALPLSTWEQLYVQIGFGVLFLAPFWWLAPAAPVTAHNLPLILYAGIAASIGAPFCWMNGIKRIGPARASVFMNLLPLLVALGAWGLLGERLRAYHAAGGALVLAGLLWSQRGSRPH